MKFLQFLATGILFGIVLFKSEAASWFRIYEMFQFQSFHMYGIIGSALAVGVLLHLFIKKGKLKTTSGSTVVVANKEKSVTRYLVGGLIFGLGWGLAGACPGPMFVLIGSGFVPILIVLLAAIFGTWVYGLLKNKLPH